MRNHTPRHRAPGLALLGPSSQRRVLACAAMIAVSVISGAAPSAASFTDTTQAQVSTATYTVPPAVQGSAQASGTGYLIQTRLQVACDDHSAPEWQFRDRVVGNEWNRWIAWSTEQSEPGWTGWVTSAIGWVGLSVETQWEVRCSTGPWIGSSQTSNPIQITRTT